MTAEFGYKKPHAAQLSGFDVHDRTARSHDPMTQAALLIAIMFVCLAPASAAERSLVVLATAYNSTPAQTDARPNKGAWGDRIEPGMRIIAVSRDLVRQGLKRGTKIRIDGVEGEWTVLDRTPSRYKKRIDLYMGVDVKAAREWGRRTVTIRWDAPDAPATP